jgi:hypothetical protein
MTVVSVSRDNEYMAMNGDIAVSGGSLGEMVSITATGSISLVPGVSGLTKYYSVYEVSTNTTIAVTLPSPTDVAKGWYCRINLISSTGVGSMTIVSHLGATVAFLSNNISFGRSQSSVSLTLIDSVPTWAEAYSVPAVGGVLQIPAMNGLPAFKQFNFGQLFSRCSASVNANTITDVAIPWNSATNIVIDNDYYTFTGGNSRIGSVLSGVYRYDAIIGINIVGSTLTNLRIRPRINGTTFLTGFVVFLASINPFASGVYCFNCEVYMAAGSYLEIMVGKSAVSAGTNPVDATNSAVWVEYISQT